MRILVFSLPRSCSSITVNLCASMFGLVNLAEVFSNFAYDQTSDAPPTFTGTHLLQQHYAREQRTPVSSCIFPEAFYTETNYCGKILTSHCLNKRFDYRTFDYSVIDRIIFTTRENLVDLMASWMLLTKFRREFATSSGHTPGAPDTYQSFQSTVDLAMLPYIQQNITCFSEVYDFISSRYASRCALISYEFYQAPTAAHDIFTALRPATSPCLSTDSFDTFATKFTAIMQKHQTMQNHKCYATDVLNYDALQAWYDEHLPAQHLF